MTGRSSEDWTLQDFLDMIGLKATPGQKDILDGLCCEKNDDMAEVNRRSGKMTLDRLAREAQKLFNREAG